MKLKSKINMGVHIKCVFEDITFFVLRGYTNTQIHQVRENEIERMALRRASINDKKHSHSW